MNFMPRNRSRYFEPDIGPRKYVTWTPEITERMQSLLDMGYSQSAVAKKLTEQFPQDNGVIFTKNSVVGRRMTITGYRNCQKGRL
jgi:hypothetical protein